MSIATHFLKAPAGTVSPPKNQLNSRESFAPGLSHSPAHVSGQRMNSDLVQVAGARRQSPGEETIILPTHCRLFGHTNPLGFSQPARVAVRRATQPMRGRDRCIGRGGPVVAREARLVFGRWTRAAVLVLGTMLHVQPAAVSATRLRANRVAATGLTLGRTWRKTPRASSRPFVPPSAGVELGRAQRLRDDPTRPVA